MLFKLDPVNRAFKQLVNIKFLFLLVRLAKLKKRPVVAAQVTGPVAVGSLHNADQIDWARLRERIRVHVARREASQ